MVLALDQPIDALLDSTGVTASETAGKLCDLELLTAKRGWDAEGELIGAGRIEVAVLEELGLKRVLDAGAVSE